MAKQQINFRASKLTIDQIEQLTRHTGMTQTEVISTAIDRMAREIEMSNRIVVDVDLSDDAMGVENGNTRAYLEMLENNLMLHYPGAELSFTHRGNGHIEMDGYDPGEAHAVSHIVNETWEEWLQSYE